METWKLLLITLLSAVVLGCVIGVVTGKRQVKKLRGGYHPLLSVKERVVYSLLVLFGAGCIAIGVFVVPNLGAADADIIYDEFGNPMPSNMMDSGMFPGEMADGGAAMEEIPGDVLINNATPEEPADGDVAEDETIEGDVAEGDAVEGETTEGEASEEETAEGDAAESDTAEDETEAAVTYDADDTGNAAAAAAPAPAPRRVIRSGGGMVVEAFRVG